MTLQDWFSVAGTLMGGAALFLNWRTRIDLKRQSSLRASLEVEEEPLGPENFWHLARLKFRNPADVPVQIVSIEKAHPRYFGPITMAFALPNSSYGYAPDSFVLSHVDLRVPPASRSLSEDAWTNEILLLFGATARRMSHTTLSIRLTYHETSDIRRAKKIHVTSNPVTLRQKPANKKIESADIK